MEIDKVEEAKWRSVEWREAHFWKEYRAIAIKYMTYVTACGCCDGPHVYACKESDEDDIQDFWKEIGEDE